MRIAQIALPSQRLSPNASGGTQRIVSLLTNGLVKRGHTVTVYATGNSITSARLRHVFEQPTKKHCISKALAHASLAFSYADEFDVIHNHLLNGISYVNNCSTSCITSVDTSLSDANVLFFLRYYRHYNYVALSQRQIQLLPELNWNGIVYNGIDVAEWPFNTQKRDYVVWIGKLRPEKGAHLAIQAALRSKIRLILMGPKELGYEKYFQVNIVPYLDNEKIIYLGEVGEERKKVIKNARALLFPIIWEEAFGLVMLEAMACGTPVIAFNIGAVPEVVKHDQTGFIVSGIEEMADAISNVSLLDPFECRDHVHSNFSVDAMVEGFLKIYEHLVSVNK